MQWPIKVQSPLIERSEVDWIKQTMEENPRMGRTPLSVKLCERWDWRGSDGQLKDIASAELLRKLEKLELLRLPPGQTGGGSGKAPQSAIVPVDDSPICCLLGNPKAVVDKTVISAKKSRSKPPMCVSIEKGLSQAFM